jgi:hypothetical protein
MRFIYAAVTLFASLALAQQNAISIPEGQSTLDVTAGQQTTIVWTNPSEGTVTIKLQESGPNITPESGIVLGCKAHFFAPYKVQLTSIRS